MQRLSNQVKGWSFADPHHENDLCFGHENQAHTNMVAHSVFARSLIRVSSHNWLHVKNVNSVASQLQHELSWDLELRSTMGSHRKQTSCSSTEHVTCSIVVFISHVIKHNRCWDSEKLQHRFMTHHDDQMITKSVVVYRLVCHLFGATLVKPRERLKFCWSRSQKWPMFGSWKSGSK